LNYQEYPKFVVEDIARLRRRIKSSGIPPKAIDQNLIIGTWNIRNFGSLFNSWEENPDSPKRNSRSLAYLAEIIQHFDVIAIQEVKADTSGIRALLKYFLGNNWGLILSDVSAGSKGNMERLAYIYDTRRVEPSGLAGEIVLPPTKQGDPAEQFDRTPYIVGFQSAGTHFSLLTVHIRYGNIPSDRLGEITSLAKYVAHEIRDRAETRPEEQNLVVLGDFNIDDRKDNPLFKAFTHTGLNVPTQLLNIKTTYGTKPKFYDQIAWFMGELDLIYSERAGVINFVDAIYPEMTRRQMSYRVSDHFPLWSEFMVDRSEETMAITLGLDPAMPNPLDTVSD